MLVLGQKVQRFGGGYAATTNKAYPQVQVWSRQAGGGPRILACRHAPRAKWAVLVGCGAGASLHYTRRLLQFVEQHTGGMDG